MQIVKTYTDIVGDRRVGTESKSAVEQINQDLRENRHWQIHILVVAEFKSNPDLYVVYNVSESRRLVENYKSTSIELTSIDADEITIPQINSSLIMSNE